MKKLLLVLLLLCPILVFAEECSPSSIAFESIHLEKSTGNAEEKTDASINNNKVDLDVILYDPGDSLEYEIKVKNNTKDDYYFDENSLKKDTDYLLYEFSYEDDSNLIKTNESKDINLRIEYKTKVPEEVLSNDSLKNTESIKFDLSTKDSSVEPTPSAVPSNVPTDIKVPDTETKSLLFIVVLVASGIVFIIIVKEKKNKVMLLMLGLLMIYPIYTSAICKVEIVVEAKVEIDGKEAYFLTGPEVNIKMKQLAGNDTTTNGEKTIDNNVSAILHSENEPISSNKEAKNIISTDDSPYPIYAWYDEGKIYWWSEDLTPNVNENAKSMFRNYGSLIDISGLEDLDTSNTTTFHTLLAGVADSPMKYTDLKPIANWNTSKVTEMIGTFQYNTSLTNLDDLKNWDMSSVTSMYSMFLGKLAVPMNLTNIDGVHDWDVSHVIDFTGVFSSNRQLTSIKALENWDMSSAQNLNSMFGNCSSLETLEGLENWNTSTVTNMASLFHNCNHLLDGTAIRNWDVSNVTQMNNMFNVSSDMTEQSYGLLRNLDIKNWDMSKVRVYAWFLTSQPYVITEFTIRNKSASVYQGMLGNSASSNSGGHIVVNYTAETEELVEKMVATKYANSNVEKGVLVE